MGRLASVTGRGGDRVFMGDMVANLTVGRFADAPDGLVLTEPGWTLFSLDFETSEAVFVDVGATADLVSAPFCYQAQYGAARRLMRLPFAAFESLSRQVPKGAPLIQLFNIGHCGSTLLHHVFNRSGAAWCVSEPLFTFDLAMRRHDLSAAALRDLMRAGLSFLRRFPGAADADRLAVKHFSQATTIFAACHDAEPAASHLFLYRDGESWCNSVYGFAQRIVGMPLVVPPERRAFGWWIISGNVDPARLEGIVDMTAAEVTLDRFSAVAWALHIKACRQAMAAGMPMLPVRYEDFGADRTGALNRIFAHCGLSVSAVARGLAAFDADSHAGTATASAVPALPLPQEAYARIRATFAHRSLGVRGDEVLTMASGQ